jgi:hypothetical protein
MKKNREISEQSLKNGAKLTFYTKYIRKNYKLKNLGYLNIEEDSDAILKIMI